MNDFRIYGIDPAKNRPYEIPLYGIALLYRLLDVRISRYLNRFGISPIKFNVLMVTRYQGGETGLSQVEISKRIIANVSNIARLLDRMEQEGLVIRSPHDTDRRINIVKITPKGAETVDKLWDGYDELTKELVNRLNKDEQAQLSKLLAKWFIALKKPLPAERKQA